MDTYWYNLPSRSAGGKVWPRGANRARENAQGSDILQKYAINGFDTAFGGAMAVAVPGNPMNVVPDATGLGWYLYYLYEQGVIGPGKKVDTYPLPMEHYDKVEFAEAMAQCICTRTGIGDLLAEGTIRFCEKLNRLGDMATVLRYPQWGYVFHWTLPGVEWAYGSLMDSRDINSHDMQDQFGPGRGASAKTMTCEEFVNLLSKETPPFLNDPYMEG